MRLGRLLLRATVGGFFVGHGTQKLFGAFGGSGLGATAEHFEGLGLKPGKLHAGVAGSAETFGGAGLLLGYHTPLAAAAITGVMATAIDRVHFKNGPWNTGGGYEYNAVLIAAAATLAESGPGALSLDALRGKERVGARWSLFALAAGLGGAAALRALADRQAGKSSEYEAPETGSFASATPAASEPPVVAPGAPATEPAPAAPAFPTEVEAEASAADEADSDEA